MGFAQTHPVATRRKTLVRRASASGTPSARNAAKRNEHGFGVLARAQRSEHVRPSLESNPRGQQDGRLIEYVTDGKGRRIGKMVNGVLTKQWLYRDQLKPVAELDGSGNLVSEFVYGTKTNIPDYVLRGGATYRVVSDELGSPVLAANVANSTDIAFQATYAAFGGRTLVTGANEWMPLGFAGGIYDPDTGLTRFGARDYDSTIGRWVSKDPIRFDGGDANVYLYARGDPINYRDETGLLWCEIACWLSDQMEEQGCRALNRPSESDSVDMNAAYQCSLRVSNNYSICLKSCEPPKPPPPTPPPTPMCFSNNDWNVSE